MNRRKTFVGCDFFYEKGIAFLVIAHSLLFLNDRPKPSPSLLWDYVNKGVGKLKVNFGQSDWHQLLLMRTQWCRSLYLTINKEKFNPTEMNWKTFWLTFSHHLIRHQKVLISMMKLDALKKKFEVLLTSQTI